MKEEWPTRECYDESIASTDEAAQILVVNQLYCPSCQERLLIPPIARSSFLKQIEQHPK